MHRFLLSTLLLLASATTASAHFVFVVPAANNTKANVILSEDLDPDEGVDIAVIGGVKLVARDTSGQEKPLELEKLEHAYAVQFPADSTQLIHGTCVFGVMQRGDSKPFLLQYHPKTIIGDAFTSKTSLGEEAPVEIVPLGEPGAIKFQVLVKGKPVADAQVNVICPDGNAKKITTDSDGQTTAFEQRGRYGVWTRSAEPTSGEHEGKPYAEIRRYATLVVDAGTADSK
jgi:uncharacterized GH25 family protein